MVILLPHLEAHLKVFGDLIEIPRQLLSSGRPIKCRVITDGPKERFSIIEILDRDTGNTRRGIPGKYALGVRLLVDLTLPAFVCPASQSHLKSYPSKQCLVTPESRKNDQHQRWQIVVSVILTEPQLSNG
jgi:hypothetical protein